LAISACLLALAPASAAAAQRYAAPTGSGAACTKESPCSLKEAVTNAGSNDEVIVTAGSYVTEEQLLTPGGSTNVYIHGDFGGPMPKVASPKGGVPIAIIDAGGTLSYLDMTSTGTVATGSICNGPGRIDRVRVSVTGTEAVAVRLGRDCEVRDSVFRAVGMKSTAMVASFVEGDSTGLVRNVTAMASGPESTGINARYAGFFEKGTYTLDLKNAIARGGASDLSATQTTEGTAHIVVSNSNYVTAVAEGAGTIATTGPVQTAAPLFLAEANGDYREAASSPTIDAGSTDRIGAFDLDGNPRTLGSAPDIGAFEFVPPPGEIQSLGVAPRAFRARKAGGAIFSTRKKAKAPLGTLATYTVSGPATTVQFTVERKAIGRIVKGRKCARIFTSRNNRRCVFYRAVKGGFAHTGIAGQNRFKFSGRIGGKALKPGSYRLVGSASSGVKRASFKIVK
jgi:hypothetical protein